jgi:hypothetical protein
MKYALLIYTPYEARGQALPEAVEERYRAYAGFMEEAGSKLVGGEELEAPSTATTVRVDDGGDLVTTDGPFAETKEQLAGFFVVEAADLDEAIQIAGEIPSASFGSIEVRPVAPGPQQQ